MAKKKADFFTPFSNVFLLNGSKKNPSFFSAPDSAPCGGVPGRVQGRIFFTSCISSPPSPFVFHFGHLYLFTPAFEDGAGGVSREDTRGRCLRMAMGAMGVLGESVGILCSGRMLGRWRK